MNSPKSLTFLGNFCKGFKIYNFLVKSFLGNFYRHLGDYFLVILNSCTLGKERFKILRQNSDE